jgi:hypothetical protein
MRNSHSAFDRVKSHLTLRGCNKPASESLCEDLETMVRRYDEVRSLGREYGEVELSPYMSSLLRVSGMPATSLAVAGAAAAGV